MTAVLILYTPVLARAQASASATATTSVSVPRVVTVNGTYQPASGRPAPARATITLMVYTDQTGGAPLWQETQDVALDAGGRYVIQFGATQPEGLPVAIFAEGQEHWLGVQFAGPGEVEAPRTRLTSVPYALRAADAETLGGRPASDYALANAPSLSSAGAAATHGAVGRSTLTDPRASLSTAGNPGYLGMFTDSVNLGNSAGFQSGGRIGIGTTAPLDYLHISFTDTFGAFTGLAVQNRSGTSNAASGMLFYDQNGMLAQFQGFNNASHAYAINNIARNGSSQFDGSINFLIGNTSAFFVDSNGNAGIGTTTPNTGTNNVSGRLSIAAPSSDENTLFVRKPTGTFDFAIQARADAGVNGPAIGGVAGYSDGVGIAPTQSVSVFGAQANANSYAVQAYNATATGAALFASGGQFAGDFSGNVRVTGNLTVTGSVSKGSGSFKIDHPLDPANKYLSHSFVESPDMMNIYNGNVTLDANGEATVMLPDWFDALNRDFRYQLTALGAPGPNLYIAEEIANGRFKIAGGAAGRRVSWQVTGIRRDAFADAHRIAIEEDKPATERGHYLYPELYGQPADTRIGPGTTVKMKGQ
jgi:hypothetical protein